MRAIDTNIIVRIVTNDDTDQAARASAVVANNPIFLPLTVCLETEWVLRSVYRMSPTEVADALVAFAGLPTVEVEDYEILSDVIAKHRAGMDFADALHLATSAHCESMLSFDDDFINSARELGTIPVLEP